MESVADFVNKCFEPAEVTIAVPHNEPRDLTN